MDKEKNLDRAIEAAWGMFEQTGNVSYYILYKKLSGKS